MESIGQSRDGLVKSDLGEHKNKYVISLFGAEIERKKAES